MTDDLAAGATLYELVQDAATPEPAIATAISGASLPVLRIAHSLLYDEMLRTDDVLPRPGTTIRRQMVLTEIRRREIQPT